MSDYLKKISLSNFFLILAIFLLDRISKIYVIDQSKKSLSNNLFLSDYLNISLMWNEGIAFGLFAFDESFFYNFITILIIMVIIIVFFMILKNKGYKKYSLILILGGALGNLYDRIFFGAVPDFIDFHIGDFHWFVFNVADIFISIGVIIMILSEFMVTKTSNEEL
ncbi:signal peptidase II [Candidatus Pelagibacter sp.]|jgi:signal peptidase II|nr:signal peptidase II [Candidatus Pelagibacter sp.]|tara:strand:+ start:46 stop:543 length:498 start_codon:yes stop_codon:yes gene_type:complete